MNLEESEKSRVNKADSRGIATISIDVIVVSDNNSEYLESNLKKSWSAELLVQSDILIKERISIGDKVMFEGVFHFKDKKCRGRGNGTIIDFEKYEGEGHAFKIWLKSFEEFSLDNNLFAL